MSAGTEEPRKTSGIRITTKLGTEGHDEKMRALRRALTHEKGASAVEFALVAPLLFLLIFGIIQFGIAFGSQLAITHAAREGARLAAVGAFNETSVRARAYPVVPNSVSILYPNGNTHGQPVQVRVDYDMTINIPFFGQRQLPLSSLAQMRLEV
jgi:Flp pilus assembly pilin Flp